MASIGFLYIWKEPQNLYNVYLKAGKHSRLDYADAHNFCKCYYITSILYIVFQNILPT